MGSSCWLRLCPFVREGEGTPGWIRKAAELLCSYTSVVNTKGVIRTDGAHIINGRLGARVIEVFQIFGTQARISHDAFQDLGMENSC